jgi:hypothetical protein
MKLLTLRMIGTVVASLFLAFQIHAQETKKVCNKQKDAKGKEVQVCKEIKIHKKLDGIKVPEKK